MAHSEGDPFKSPADLFDEKTRGMIDFHEYLRVLVQEGVPAMLSLKSEIDSEEELDDRFRTLIGFTTHRVLENRREAGFPMDATTLLAEVLGLRPITQEFIIDPDMKRRVAQGVVMGLVISKVIPPPTRPE